MKTTSLFIEILVIGYLGCVWLSLLIGLSYGYGFQPVFTFAKTNEIFATIFITSFAYLFGILIDRISDSFLEWFDKRVRSKFETADEPSVLAMQAELFFCSPDFADRISYQQHRLRIVRSGVLNVALIVVFGILFLVFRVESIPTSTIWALLFVGLSIWVATCFTYKRITHSYWGRTNLEYKTLKETETLNDSARDS